MRFFIVILLTLFAFSADIENLITQAKKGNVGAIFKLAYAYENGLGVKKDEKKAYKLYQKAATLGDEDAKVALSLFELKNNVKSSKKISNKVVIQNSSNFFKLEAAELQELIKKAKQNNKEALFTLGALYESGFSQVSPNPKKALSLYKKAAKLGSKKAKEALKRFK